MMICILIALFMILWELSDIRKQNERGLDGN